jgi:DNA polymerase III psi subunit
MDSSVFNSDFYRAIFNNEELYFIKNAEKNEIVLVGTKLEITDNEPVALINEVETVEENKVEIAENAIVPLLILVDEISEANKVFLEKILNAVKLNLEKVDLITQNQLKTQSFLTISENKTYSRILSFGVPLSSINLSIMLSPYQPQKIDNIWFLMAENLVVVESDVVHKRSLWECLQKMFL